MTPFDYERTSAAWRKAQAETAQDAAMDARLQLLFESTENAASDDEYMQRFDDELEDAHFEEDEP